MMDAFFPCENQVAMNANKTREKLTTVMPGLSSRLALMLDRRYGNGSFDRLARQCSCTTAYALFSYITTHSEVYSITFVGTRGNWSFK